jgi:hypothetical protein
MSSSLPTPQLELIFVGAAGSPSGVVYEIYLVR